MNRNKLEQLISKNILITRDFILYHVHEIVEKRGTKQNIGNFITLLNNQPTGIEIIY